MQVLYASLFYRENTLSSKGKNDSFLVVCLSIQKMKRIQPRVYFTIRGGSRKKIAKKIIPSVPTSKKV